MKNTLAILLVLLLPLSGCSSMLHGGSRISYSKSAEELQVHPAVGGVEDDNLVWVDGKLHIKDGVYFCWDKRFQLGEAVTQRIPHPNEGLTRFIIVTDRRRKRVYEFDRHYRGPMAYGDGLLVFPDQKNADTLLIYEAGDLDLGEALRNTVNNGFGIVFGALSLVGIKGKLNGNRIRNVDDAVGYQKNFYKASSLPLRHGEVEKMVLDEKGELCIKFKNGVYSVYQWSGKSFNHRASFTFESMDSWTLWTPHRFFDQAVLTPPSHLPHYEIEKFGQVSFSQLSDVYQRPDLVNASFSEKTLPAEDAAGVSIVEALSSPPPTVSISATRRNEGLVEVKVVIASTGGGIGDVRIFHNGKLAWSKGYYRDQKEEPMLASAGKENGRGLVRREVLSASPKRLVMQGDQLRQTVSYVLAACSGDNLFTAEAFNHSNTVRSAQNTVFYRDDDIRHAPETYVLAVGIDKFRDRDISLHFAAKDARDVAHLFGRIGAHTHLLTNGQATKENLLGYLHSIGEKMRPEDRFIFYIATHGVRIKDGYSLLLANFGGAIRDETTLSSRGVMDIIKDIPALEQMVIMDTCYAGRVAGLTDGLFDARTRKLGRTMGIHLYAGASSKEAAFDGYEGNGLFTHFLLKALSGGADANHDDKLEALELSSYLKRSVSEASKGLQSPVIVEYGNWDSPVLYLTHQSK